jgi:hypothetical protein
MLYPNERIRYNRFYSARSKQEKKLMNIILKSSSSSSQSASQPVILERIRLIEKKQEQGKSIEKKNFLCH